MSDALVADERLAVLAEELDAIHIPGDDFITLQQVRKAINRTVLRLPAVDDYRLNAVQKFEERANDAANWQPNFGFRQETIQDLINYTLQEK